MLLLTGATGTIGLPLLRRLTAAGEPVRCLVRDPRRLGPERVRVSIALGELGDPRSFRHALRGVDTVVHLAATIRDQPAGSIEQLSGVATVRLLQAAESAGVERFVFFSVLGAGESSPVRLLRAKAMAEQAVVDSPIPHTVFALGWVYGLEDPFMRLTRRLGALPVVPVAGSGQARSQPIWAEDVADCVRAVLRGGAHVREAAGVRYELAGPETLSYEQIVARVLAGRTGPRRIVHVSPEIVRRSLRVCERIMRGSAFATPDEADLLEVTVLAGGGTSDAERLGVTPRALAEVLAGAPAGWHPAHPTSVT